MIYNNDDKCRDLNINENDGVNDEIEETENESNESIRRNKSKQVIFQLNEKARARFVEGNANIFFEIKANKESDDTDNNYKNNGYFGDICKLLQYAFSLNCKEKLFSKNEVVKIEDMIAILKESKDESRQQAKEIIASIANNSCVKEITQEAIERCKVK